MTLLSSVCSHVLVDLGIYNHEMPQLVQIQTKQTPQERTHTT